VIHPEILEADLTGGWWVGSASERQRESVSGSPRGEALRIRARGGAKSGE